MDTVNKPRKKPTKIEEMSREQIRQAILKKKECNSKAQRIVETLLETGITEVYLLECLAGINQSHFDDVIEERSISHLCGYPICENSISLKDIPKQKYRISLKTNKVYDITARKSFCSNSCYRAAMYVKKQMLTSPLWFREYENIPKFHLLPLDSTGSMGQEIDVALINRVQVKPENKLFTSIYDFTTASLHEMQGDDQLGDDDKSKAIMKTENNAVETNNTSLINENIVFNTESHNQPSAIIMEKPVETELSMTEKLHNLTIRDSKKPPPNPMNIVGEIFEKPGKNIDPNLIGNPNISVKESRLKQVLKKNQPLVTSLAIEVEKCLAEWFTLDTMLYLFGDERVREMVTDKGECIKEYLNNYAKGVFYNASSYDQYQQLCKRLNMLELEDRKHDSQTLHRESKPLPDYAILQEESKKMKLKVKAFFAGETEISESASNERVTSIPEDDSQVTNLPLVDKNAQNALRRRIVCQHLNKVLPDLLRSLGLLTLTISSDVHLLVNTFKLKANNIMFKPVQWTLIAIVFIKLLSIRDKRLAHLLEQPMAFQHMQLLLLSYKQDGGYLDRLISWLTDIDRLLDTNDTQLTVE